MKHFAAHGQPESGMNCAPVNVSERVLRETFLYPFEQAIREGGAISVMASYNEIDGVPSHASRWLLRDVLRDEWAFEGFVVSDYYAILELYDRPDTHGHHVAAGRKDACALAVRAGVNIELPDPDCYEHLVELVREGRLAEGDLDELVAPMLRWKFEMGLFDDPYVDPDEADRIVGSEKNAKLALQAARESITLLKNEGDVLPLDENSIDKIAVKLYAERAEADDDDVVAIFHQWIREGAVGGMPLDVADYGHVPDGPGVLLVGHETDFGLDRMEGPVGLLVNRKRGLQGEDAQRIATLLREAAAAAMMSSTPRLMELSASCVVRQPLTTMPSAATNAAVPLPD